MFICNTSHKLRLSISIHKYENHSCVTLFMCHDPDIPYYFTWSTQWLLPIVRVISVAGQFILIQWDHLTERSDCIRRGQLVTFTHFRFGRSATISSYSARSDREISFTFGSVNSWQFDRIRSGQFTSFTRFRFGQFVSISSHLARSTHIISFVFGSVNSRKFPEEIHSYSEWPAREYLIIFGGTANGQLADSLTVSFISSGHQIN